MVEAARHLRPLQQLYRAFWRDIQGGPLVEFTLILPILLSLVLGGTQYGLLLFVHNNMQDAARSAARQLGLGRVTAEQAETLAASQLVGWPTNWDISAQDVDVTGTNDVRIVITVPAVEASVIRFVPMPAEIRTEVLFPKE